MTVFEWDEEKNSQNIEKHGISFEDAAYAFNDPKRITYRDDKHSDKEERFHCLGKVGDDVLTVRFVIRNNNVRIIGAGHWREGRKEYEKRNNLH